MQSGDFVIRNDRGTYRVYKQTFEGFQLMNDAWHDEETAIREAVVKYQSSGAVWFLEGATMRLVSG